MKRLYHFLNILSILLIILSFIACDSWLFVFFSLGNSSDYEAKVEMRFQWQTLEDMLPTDEQRVRTTTVFDTTIVIPPHSVYKDKYDLGLHGWYAEVEHDINFSEYGIIPMWESIITVIVHGDTIPCNRIRNRSEWAFDGDDAEFSYDIGRDIIEFYSR